MNPGPPDHGAARLTDLAVNVIGHSAPRMQSKDCE